MNVKNELKALAERMFNDELLGTLLEAYQQEANEDGYGIVEKEYSEGTEALSTILNEEQKTALIKMEKLCEENIRYGVKFGFASGVFAGFQQFFVEETTKQPFEDFIDNEILKEPNIKKHGGYYQRRCELNDINTALEEQLDTDNREHLISVYSAWDNRLYGLLRHSFYMGYRYAIEIINHVKPLSASMNMIDKILLTEYELGFIRTLSEQEQRTTQCTDV